nr:immunoglobulin heavy chain junction region [Mus musculus]MBK4187297.1 immunoglobulin heavy chain junction region [Mus musculus]MBK4187298.1 immunoglobulin heavy chain junction region [Mus musculus]
CARRLSNYYAMDYW